MFLAEPPCAPSYNEYPCPTMKGPCPAVVCFLFCALGIAGIATAADQDLLAVAEGTRTGGSEPLRLQVVCRPGEPMLFSPTPWIRRAQTTNAPAGEPRQTVTSTYSYTLTGKVDRIVAVEPGRPLDFYGSLQASWLEEHLYEYDFTGLN